MPKHSASQLHWHRIQTILKQICVLHRDQGDNHVIKLPEIDESTDTNEVKLRGRPAEGKGRRKRRRRRRWRRECRSGSSSSRGLPSLPPAASCASIRVAAGRGGEIRPAAVGGRATQRADRNSMVHGASTGAGTAGCRI
ncbi:unnamed protein product [Prorocentrum cordatum]|uniref:Uncharacterized protein n=1 Tax=Prorocentrum cordatum TaxID=2364126 RepID=A0ABN9SD40_9DINO|nr:unnamed protein product [Polarella glacialis]